MEKVIISFSILGSLIALPYITKQEYMKDRIILFFMTGFVATLIDLIVVELGLVSYPDRWLSQIYEIHILFDLWLLPILVMLHDHTTLKASYYNTMFQALIYSGLLTALEWYAEKETDLIEWISWSWLDTFISVFLIILCFRFIIYVIREVAD